MIMNSEYALEKQKEEENTNIIMDLSYQINRLPKNDVSAFGRGSQVIFEVEKQYEAEICKVIDRVFLPNSKANYSPFP